MSNLILNKDCLDFVPLKDGTIKGDFKYCDLSTQCRQVGMKSDYYEFYDHNLSSNIFDYFCTGCYVDKDNEEDIKDEEIS